MTPTPDELRAAADAFARLGRTRSPLEAALADAMADASERAAAVLRGEPVDELAPDDDDWPGDDDLEARS